MNVEHRLATYGSLALGQPNHDQLEDLQGTWRRGTVRGRLIDSGWGSAIGFPGLVLDDQAFEVPVSLFESPQLSEHWDRLDAFEGDGCQRVVAKITVDGEVVDAFLYAAAKRVGGTGRADGD